VSGGGVTQGKGGLLFGNGNVASGDHSTVSGGAANGASGNATTVGGGIINTASGSSSTVPGGSENAAQGDFSFAVGHRAKANHDGAFVWADSTDEDFTSTGENQFLIRAVGGVGIGTDSPTERLTVNGNVLADDFLTPSSGRWKTDIQTIEGALEKVKDLRGVSYDWKTDGRHDIGLIAEEVGKVVPEVVTYEANGQAATAVDYTGLVPVLIEAIKEQQQLLEERDTELEALQEDNRELETRIETLEKVAGVETKGVQAGRLPFTTSVIWILVSGLGLLVVTPGLVLRCRRTRRNEE
jgi:hypothetical protein